MSEILNWYEAGLPAPERKRRGHFSTPPALVACILDACGYSPEQDLAHLRVLDPACGSGNFLAGAAHRLVAYARRAGLDHEALTDSVQRNIWGFDPDPVACFLAEMQLRAVLEDCSCWHELRLHIHQADGLALAWEQCSSIDLFLANPPYLAAKNSDLSGYRSTQRNGQMDSYLLFLRLALQVVRPGGWMGLILPDPVLARANAAKERRQLLEQTTVHHLWHLSGVFPASVGVVVIIAQKQPAARQHRISWVRERWQRVVAQETEAPAPTKTPPVRSPSPLPGAKTVAQSLLSQQPGAELRYLLNEVAHTLVAQLQAHLCESTAPDEERRFVPLGALTRIWRGEELGKDSPLLTGARSSVQHGWYPVVRGGVDVRPYAPPVARCWIVPSAVTKPLELYLAPKLLVVKSSGQLQATLDLQGHIALQTLYLLNSRRVQGTSGWSEQCHPERQRRIRTRPAGGSFAAAQDDIHDLSHEAAVLQNHLNKEGSLDDLYFLLALLNSRLLREYVYVLYTAYKWVQPQIEQHILAQLPIPVATPAEKARIVELAKALTRACSQIPSVVELKQQELYAALEHAICQLYATALQSERSPALRNCVDKGVTVYG
jgi:SAM-dependent methyltransferase